ncbi:MAG: hypothetical protein AAF961_00840 [Planctomycetota bacterium]
MAIEIEHSLVTFLPFLRVMGRASVSEEHTGFSEFVYLHCCK